MPMEHHPKAEGVAKIKGAADRSRHPFAVARVTEIGMKWKAATPSPPRS